jgi:hypothetical protein
MRKSLAFRMPSGLLIGLCGNEHKSFLALVF